MTVEQIRQQMAVVANQLNQARAMNNRPLIVTAQRKLGELQAQFSAATAALQTGMNFQFSTAGGQANQPTQTEPVHPDDALYTNGNGGSSYILPIGIGAVVLIAAAGGVGYWWWRKSNKSEESEE